MNTNKMDFTIKTIFGPYVMTSISRNDEKPVQEDSKMKEIFEVIDDYVEQA